jgi:very-short-patch-repair endonuclease
MHKSFDVTVDLLSGVTHDQQTNTLNLSVLPGLYPWLRFGEFFTRDDWAQSFGFNLDLIDYKAATAYLVGEAAFFEAFANESIRAIGQEKAMALAQVKLEGMRRRFIHAAVHLCGSQIEQVMLAALVWARYGHERRLVEIWDSAADPGKPLADVVIAPQYQIENCRVDFAIFINVIADEEIRIVVECDGHWHEKDKQQAARDKKRDRDVTIAGWRWLRFSGSEIWRDHRWCGSYAATLVRNEIEAQLRRRGFL